MLYDGKPVAENMRTWHRTREVRSLDEHRTQITVTWRDPTTKFAVRCEAVEYRDFPAVEWVLHLTNEGQAATPILSDIRPLAISVAMTPASPARCTMPRAALPPGRLCAAAARAGTRAAGSSLVPQAAGRPTASCPFSTCKRATAD